jgi:DNA adenine methylase
MTTNSNSKYQLMPAMTPAQYAELKDDIKRRGVLVPIEFDGEGNILDGHHRYQAFTELIEEGADLPLYDKIVRRFSSEEEKVAYVVSLNVKRRHLNAEQRQELVVRLRKEFGYTLSKIAQILGISIATASRDIDALPPHERDELKSIAVQGADGRAYNARAWSEVPRTFSTGIQQLRTMQNAVINEAAAGLAEKYMAEAEQELAEKKEAQSLSTQETPPTPAPNGSAPREAVISDSEAKERMSAFAWYGGKASHLAWLLPLLPRCKHFVDVFGGSAAVLLNRDPSPIETYNDLDNNVVNFFRVVRSQPDELMRLLHLTPYSREDRKEALRAMREPPPNTTLDLEHARLFFIMARQTQRGQAQMITDSELNAWRFTRNIIQRGIAVYNAQWQSGIDGLAAIAARLRNVQIENYPALDVIRLYNDPGVLLYCDPPYVHDTRRLDKTSTYAFEMSVQDHINLSAALHKHQGLVALSGYPSPLYDDLYADWFYIDMPYQSASVQITTSSLDASRIERLWTNYDLGIKR